MMSRYACLLWLLLAAPGALAQEPEKPEEPGPTNGADEAATGTSPPAEQAAGSEPPDAPGDAGSPFEYQASEQISEDLSVSFPVDI